MAQMTAPLSDELKIIMHKKPNLRSNPEEVHCAACPIRGQALFRGIPAAELEWIEEFRDAQYLLKARDLLYRQGETAYLLYTLYDGWLILFRILDGGERQILRFVLPGDFIGFQVNGSGAAAGYTHGAQALIDSTLCAFPRPRLREMMERQPQLAIGLAEMGMHDMTLCQHHLVGTGRKTAKQSIAFLLLELFHRVQRQMPHGYEEQGNSVIFPLTQEDIGDALGLTSVHVNRVLKEMEREGYIACRKRRLTIRNQEALMEIGQFDPGMITPCPLI
jgi:CRP-like cAMP-binding protein